MVNDILAVALTLLVSFTVGLFGYFVGAIHKESYGTSRYEEGIEDGYNKRKVEETLGDLVSNEDKYFFAPNTKSLEEEEIIDHG